MSTNLTYSPFHCPYILLNKTFYSDTADILYLLRSCLQDTETTLFSLAEGNLLEESHSLAELVEEWQDQKKTREISAFERD